MTKLADAMAYLIAKYPKPHQLSKARLTKMVYLADWVSVISFGRTITNIRWYFNHYGPYVDDVVDQARSNPAFRVVETRSFYGNPKERIELAVSSPATESLTSEDKRVLDHVITHTSGLNWDDFIRAVYSTYPVMTQARGTHFDLISLGRDYKATQGSTA